jgi:hypothetical protein
MGLDSSQQHKCHSYSWVVDGSSVVFDVRARECDIEDKGGLMERGREKDRSGITDILLYGSKRKKGGKGYPGTVV